MAQIDLANGPSGMVALFISMDEGIRSAWRRPFPSFAFIASVAIGSAFALLISATGRGSETTVKDLLNSEAALSQFSFGDVERVLSQASGLLTGLAAFYTALLVSAVNIQTKAERQREIKIKRQRGVHVWEIFAELFTEALVLSGIGAVLGVAAGIGLARLVPRYFSSLHTRVIERDMLGAAVIVVMLGVISLLAVGWFILRGQILPSRRRG